MRLIGTLDDEQKALIFSVFLQQKGIIHQLEVITDTDWGSAGYGTRKANIWIYDEDQVGDAIKWYQFFLDHPDDPQFKGARPSFFHPHPQPVEKAPVSDAPPSHKEDTFEPDEVSSPGLSAWEAQPLGPITRLLLMICSSLLFLAYLYTPLNPPANTMVATLISSPVDQALLYDYPKKYELIQKLYQQYGEEGFEQPESLPPEGRQLVRTISRTKYWQGLYPVVKKRGLDAFQMASFKEPMFEKIRAGEWWRLFTPAVLHADFFHLFFNMLWLLILGKQIEQRLTTVRYIVFLLLVGIFSNTAQYLMSGPNFMGFSGILCGMLTFIWARQQSAPWEGYQLDRLTIGFMMLFILSMAAIEVLFFIFGGTEGNVISINLANTAHLSGAFLGYILGSLNAFSWRPA